MSKRKTPPKVIENLLGYNIRHHEDKAHPELKFGIWGHNKFVIATKTIEDARSQIRKEYERKHHIATLNRERLAREAENHAKAQKAKLAADKRQSANQKKRAQEAAVLSKKKVAKRDLLKGRKK